MCWCVSKKSRGFYLLLVWLYLSAHLRHESNVSLPQLKALTVTFGSRIVAWKYEECFVRRVCHKKRLFFCVSVLLVVVVFVVVFLFSWVSLVAVLAATRACALETRRSRSTHTRLSCPDLSCVRPVLAFSCSSLLACERRERRERETRV